MKIMIWKHTKKTEPISSDAKDLPTDAPSASSAPVEKKSEPKDVSPEALRELLEKNLKWSQIIYEQNRKLNGKMFWYAFSGWVRVLLILAPLLLALWFLPPLVRDFFGKYENIMDSLQSGGKVLNGKTVSPSSLEQLLKILPLNVLQQEQIKAILK